MKALTVCQPFAHLISIGEKSIENRTGPTYYRGPLAIHAGKSRRFLKPGDEQAYPEMVFGAIVAHARLIDCVRVENLTEPLRSSIHAHGPWCWILEDVEPLEVPVPTGGMLGFWEWPPCPD